MDPALSEHILSDSSNDFMEAIVKLANPKVVPVGMSVVAQFDDIATCRLPVNDIESIRYDEAVYSLKAPRLISAEPTIDALEESSSQQPQFVNNTEYTGKGVAVGVVDWGFDFTHPDFLHPDGTTRFRAIWDQTAPTDASSGKYGYGRVFTRQQINDALQTNSPFESLGYHPASGDPDNSGSHATHVTSIAAGNGNAGEPGIATEADIIAVHLSAGKTGGLATLGDSVRILEAIDFIGKIAGEMPLVINLSVGKHGGAHQGNSLVEQGMDNFLKEKPGRAIVNSGGNYYSTKIHTSGRVLPGRTASLHWETDRNDPTSNELEVWYSGKDRLRLKINVPGRNTYALTVDLGETQDIVFKGQVRGRAYHRAKEPNTGNHHIDIFLYKNAPKGTWVITLEAVDVVDGRYHAWIERDSNCRSCQSKFSDQDADPNYTTGSICNGLYTIAVGAVNNNDPMGKPASFSSAGPTADGRKKPNLLAPGVAIKAARSSPAQAVRSVGEYAVKSGTSMAAPRVTGAVALLFEAAGRLLSIEETRNLLLSSLDPPPENVLDDKDSFRYGEGYLNIEKLVLAGQPSLGLSTQFAMKDNLQQGFEEDYSSEKSECEGDAVINPELGGLDLDWEANEEDIGEYDWSFYKDEAEEYTFEDSEEDSHYENDDEDSEEGSFHENYDEGTEEKAPYEEVWQMGTPYNDCGCGGSKKAKHQHWGQHGECRECGEYLVEQASEWAVSGGGAADFLDGFFATQRASLVEDFASIATNGKNAIGLFDNLVSYKSLPQKGLSTSFHVVALPGDLLPNLLPGDLVLTRSTGEGKVWQSLVLDGELLNYQQALEKGEAISGNKPGVYIETLTAQPIRRLSGVGFSKRIGDEVGRVLRDCVILRANRAAFNLKEDLSSTGFTVLDDNTLLRSAPPALTPTGKTLPQYTQVAIIRDIVQNGKTYAEVRELLPSNAPSLGWTLKSNLEPNLDWAAFKQALVRTANAELNFWTTPSIKQETNSATFNKQRDYWSISGSSPTNSELGSIDWQNGPIGADGKRHNGHAWSAVFISWCVKQAGAGRHFLYSAAHSNYIVNARNHRRNGNTASPFWAYALNAPEAAWPEPGDILCKNGTERPFHTLDSIAAGDHSHCDIVVALNRQLKQIEVVGGNVDDRVAKRIVALDDLGHVKSTGNWTTENSTLTDVQSQFFALIKVRTGDNCLGGTTTGTATSSESHSRAYFKESADIALEDIWQGERFQLEDIIWGEETNPCGAIGTGGDPTSGGRFKAGYTDIPISKTYTIMGVICTVVTTMRVAYPTDALGKDKPFTICLDDAPVVFMAHGNHYTRYNPLKRCDERSHSDAPDSFPVLNNHLGYAYFQEKLAELGIISASVDCNELNELSTKNNIVLRTYFLLAAIETAQSENKRKGAVLYKRFNLKKTGLFGHSRGAEAVLRVRDLIGNQKISGVQLSGIISLAPTDWGSWIGDVALQTKAPDEVPLLMMLPAADGDVVENDGAKFYDRHRPSNFKSQLYVHRANHNFFNTEWVWDDAFAASVVPCPVDDLPCNEKEPSCTGVRVLTRDEHQQILLSYGCAFFRKTLLNQSRWFGILMGRQKPKDVNFQEIHISAEKASALIVDDFEDGNFSPNKLTGTNTQIAGFGGNVHDLNQNSSNLPRGMLNSFFGDTKGMIAQTITPSAEIRVNFDKMKDLKSKEIWLRAAELFKKPLPSVSEFELGLEDSTGEQAFFNINQFGGVPHPFVRDDSFNKTMMKTFAFPTNCFQQKNKKLKLKNIVAIIIKHPKNVGIVYDQIQIY